MLYREKCIGKLRMMKLNVQIMLHCSLVRVDSHHRSLAVHPTSFRAFKLAGTFRYPSCFDARPEHVIDVIHSPPFAFSRATETPQSKSTSRRESHKTRTRAIETQHDRFTITF